MRTTADISAILPDDFEGRLPPDAISRGVNLEEADQVAGALRKAWSFPVEREELRRDALLLTQVKAEMTGRAMLLPDGDEVEVMVLSGGEKEKFRLTRLGRLQRPSSGLPPHARRLQMLIRGIRRTLGKGGWGINWVDDGKVCWIVSFT